MKARDYAIISLLVGMIACKEDVYKTKAIEISHSIDSLRPKLDLPPITDNLELESYGMDAAIWENSKGSFPKLLTKSVFWDSSGIYEERNYFYKSDTERLQVYYIFKPLKGIDTLGICRFYQKSLSDSGIFFKRDQSDSLLKNWHLK